MPPAQPPPPAAWLSDAPSPSFGFGGGGAAAPRPPPPSAPSLDAAAQLLDADDGRQPDLGTLLACAGGAPSYTSQAAGVRRARSQPPLPPSRALLTRSRSARQVPPLLEVVSVTRVPPVVLERLATRTASSVCGLLPAIGRAWASVDGSLFLWRYDVECVPRSRCDARRCLSFLPRLTLVRLFARAATRRRSKRRSAPTTS